MANGEGFQMCSIEVETSSTEERGDYHYASFAPENSPCVLSWKDLVVTTKAKVQKQLLNGSITKAKVFVQKQLLNNLNGSITGGLWAIMGSSGSGYDNILTIMFANRFFRKDNFPFYLGHEIGYISHERIWRRLFKWKVVLQKYFEVHVRICDAR
jgi:hypothetical protein